MADIVSMILLGAFSLGLLSWGLAGASLLLRNTRLCAPSMACCALSLLLACIYFYGGVRCGDWDTLTDTAGAMLLGASVLTGVTLCLNAAAWIAGVLRPRRY